MIASGEPSSPRASNPISATSISCPAAALPATSPKPPPIISVVDLIAVWGLGSTGTFKRPIFNLPNLLMFRPLLAKVLAIPYVMAFTKPIE